MASQLRNRKQGIDESPVMYCFDKLNLCNRVDPRMTEGVNLDHLIRGMKPTLVEKIYPSIDFAHPNTAASVQLVQLHHQATWVANSNDWAPPETDQPVNQFLVGSPGTSSHSSSVPDGHSKFVTQAQLTNQLENFEKQLTSKLEKDLKGEFTKHKRELRDDFKEIQEKGFEELLESVGKTVRAELKTNGNGHQQKRLFGGANIPENRFNGGNLKRRQRTEEGRPICFKCRHPSHLARNCGDQRRLQQQPANANDSLPKN